MTLADHTFVATRSVRIAGVSYSAGDDVDVSSLTDAQIRRKLFTGVLDIGAASTGTPSAGGIDPGTVDGQLARWDDTEEKWVPITGATYGESVNGSPAITVQDGAVAVTVMASGTYEETAIVGFSADLDAVDDMAGMTYLASAGDGLQLATAGEMDLSGQDGVILTGGGTEFRVQSTGVSFVGAAQIGGNPLSPIGFYGHTKVAQQTGVPVTAAGIHAALVALGLITA